ncbi:MAG: SDR family NAD(P)-dependent oxidoreductase [Deltaproteobacteria bacterium]
MMKSILITGCSSGIGYAAAHGLKAKGWRVFATCRKQADCERLIGEGLESFRLDYTDQTTIHGALAEVLSRTGGTLDALYNNGAYGLPAAVEDVPTDALRAMFETNVFGYHELTRAVLPVMRKQGYGRIINCSSVLGFTVIKWRGAYSATKHALEGLTDTLRIELRDTPIKIILIEPGPITSAIRANSVAHFEKWIDWKNSPVRERYESYVIKRLYSAKSGPDPFERPAEHVTKFLIHALESRNPKPRYYITVPTHVAGWLKRLLPTRLQDWLVAR